MIRLTDIFRLGRTVAGPLPPIALPDMEPLSPLAQASSASTFALLQVQSCAIGSDHARELALGVIDGASRFLEGGAP